MPSSHHAPVPPLHREVRQLQRAIRQCWQDFDRQLQILADLTGKLTCEHEALRQQLSQIHDTIFALRRQHGRNLDDRFTALRDACCSESQAAVLTNGGRRRDASIR